MTDSKMTTRDRNWTTIRTAIDRSMSHDAIVRVEIESLEAALDIIASLPDYDSDSARENDGSIDVWGWSEETPDDEQDWRLRLVEAEAEVSR